MPLSTSDIYANVKYMKECCQDEAKFPRLKWLVRSGANLRTIDNTGLNALCHAAIGKRRQPNVAGFNFLFKQKRLPYSTVEKIEALELMGSSYIFDLKLNEGLDCWEKAAKLRSRPRSRLLEEELPCAIRNYVREEWTCLDDVEKMKREISSFYGGLNVTYQAMLVRLRFHVTSSGEVLEYLCKRISKLLEFNFEYIRPIITVHIAKWLVLLYEWDLLYAPRSLPTDKGSNSMISWTITNLLRNYDIRDYLLRFEISKVFLGWLVREFEESPDEDTALRLAEMITLALKVPLTTCESLELKNFVKRLVAVGWRNLDGKCLMLFACHCVTNHRITAENSQPLPITDDLVALLAQAGANVNGRDKNGDTCLHLLVNSSGRFVASEPVLVLLLNRGLQWDVHNNRNETAQGKMNRLGNTMQQIVSASASYFSLKWLCMRKIKCYNMLIGPNFIPKTVVKDIEMQEI